MTLPKFEYAQPQSTAEACQLLAARGGEAHVIAGGTDLIMALKNRQKVVKMLVDLSAISGLNQISYSETNGLKIGALVSLRHLAASPVVKQKYPILAQAALAVGTAQLQAMGTVGGNLCQDTCCMYFNRSATMRQSLEPCHKLGGDVCHVVNCSEDCWATYAGDLAPALLVLGAKTRIAGLEGEKVVSLTDLFSNDGTRPHTLRPGQFITEIDVPPSAPHSGGVYLKLRQRETLDYALLGVAVNLTMEPGDGICKDAALALTAVDKGPLLVEEAKQLNGKKPTDELISAVAKAAREKSRPIKSLYGFTVHYRREMIPVYVELAMQQARQRAVF